MMCSRYILHPVLRCGCIGADTMPHVHCTRKVTIPVIVLNHLYRKNLKIFETPCLESGANGTTQGSSQSII
jgi:hypothetical protein